MVTEMDNASLRFVTNIAKSALNTGELVIVGGIEGAPQGSNRQTTEIIADLGFVGIYRNPNGPDLRVFSNKKKAGPRPS